jgi:xanthine dehydrogenase small subunit
MNRLLCFRINERDFSGKDFEETMVLDFLRRKLGLHGTKEGCREGDCGACTVLLGEDFEGQASWRAVPSCLLALGELDGRHLVTIEGLARDGLTPVMKALLDEGASQCGFCSPGIVLALTAFLLDSNRLDPLRAIVAVEGNLCRCTGYGAIRRAARRLAADFAGLEALPPSGPARLARLAEAGVIPPGLASLMGGFPAPGRIEHGRSPAHGLAIGSGSDYFVRHPYPEPGMPVSFLDHDQQLRHIELHDGCLELGAGVSWRDFFAHPLTRGHLPGVEAVEDRIASLPIRNRATVAGNIVNASPIADLSAVLLALDARLRLRSARRTRQLPLAEFFLDYKKTALAPGEIVETIRIPLPAAGSRFNFEKVSKRAHLDIATVNSAASLVCEGRRIVSCRLSAGGMAPIPLRLEAAEAFLAGKTVDAATVREAAGLAAAATRPISDVRGSAEYRRRLLERLVMVHFARLVPEAGLAEELWP